MWQRPVVWPELFLLGLARHPLGSERRQVVHALEQVGAGGSDDVAVAAVVDQAGFAQFLDACVERVRGDTAHAVLQQAKGLGVAIPQRPQHADGIARLQQPQQLADGSILLRTHALYSSGPVLFLDGGERSVRTSCYTNNSR